MNKVYSNAFKYLVFDTKLGKNGLKQVSWLITDQNKNYVLNNHVILEKDDAREALRNIRNDMLQTQHLIAYNLNRHMNFLIREDYALNGKYTDSIKDIFDINDKFCLATRSKHLRNKKNKVLGYPELYRKLMKKDVETNKLLGMAECYFMLTQWSCAPPNR